MTESKKEFVALRLDEVIHEWEADAPAGGSGSAGPLVTAQRHRAEIDSATDERVDEIADAYPEIAQAWSSRGA
ncbi:hypothetical protein [Rhodococcus opacus]|uniref:hypothetical protein n=1 Tax=Rhodococcus opacus TaxID=37919 RepID=UPI000319A543|nr:hypothetical protein [Rhodococcus opacus]AHK31343.1 hypothetical protein Pd630_LPD04130 [Rhodococcus opacus PD630]KXF49940.1 hypothetical protein AXA44_22300 [Rhodococcus sp. SC4]RZK70794.1 MAG: hypothetical protein EOP25_07815 [Rhodococcus sp. (in: high G+C Gram-positive bacteria)]UDG93937.1 hypothetical protein K2Z90_003909 [Rhodococcus opacus PD630]